MIKLIISITATKTIKTNLAYYFYPFFNGQRQVFLNPLPASYPEGALFRIVALGIMPSAP